MVVGRESLIDALLSVPRSEEEFTGAIVACPNCSTTEDAEDWGVQLFDCNNCETRYAVVLEPAKVHEHSMIG